ncbi:MAG: HpcH/HpaI aldolase/citrate lyase family protein [Nitratireductor sp.]|nr:HpcH/HpaI aldolase/citrate lyase family protein [Nitratireductor sp.]
MPAPKNTFKAALKEGTTQIGCWVGLADPYAVEITARAGFDWLLIDGEHCPNDLRSITAQLQVVDGLGPHAIVRPPAGEAWMIKQFLDAGAQTLLVPMVESADQARALVAAVTYPPRGIRGVGSALARASHFAGIPDYLATADDEICLIVQIENRAGLSALDEILLVEGIDAVFVGASDLAADLGHIGQSTHPEVQAAADGALRKIVEAGLPAGYLTGDMAVAEHVLALGATFVATALDVTAFAATMRRLAQQGQALKQRR